MKFLTFTWSLITVPLGFGWRWLNFFLFPILAGFLLWGSLVTTGKSTLWVATATIMTTAAIQIMQKLGKWDNVWITLLDKIIRFWFWVGLIAVIFLAQVAVTGKVSGALTEDLFSAAFWDATLLNPVWLKQTLSFAWWRETLAMLMSPDWWQTTGWDFLKQQYDLHIDMLDKLMGISYIWGLIGPGIVGILAAMTSLRVIFFIIVKGIAAGMFQGAAKVLISTFTGPSRSVPMKDLGKSDAIKFYIDGSAERGARHALLSELMMRHDKVRKGIANVKALSAFDTLVKPAYCNLHELMEARAPMMKQMTQIIHIREEKTAKVKARYHAVIDELEEGNGLFSDLAIKFKRTRANMRRKSELSKIDEKFDGKTRWYLPFIWIFSFGSIGKKKTGPILVKGMFRELHAEYKEAEKNRLVPAISFFWGQIEEATTMLHLEYGIMEDELIAKAKPITQAEAMQIDLLNTIANKDDNSPRFRRSLKR